MKGTEGLMKEAILQALRESGGYVSGQELCRQLGVSRTAVWKKIRQLQDEGYVIEAVTNKGYRIVSSPDIISQQEIKSRLETKKAGAFVICLDRIDSTNQYAKKIAEEGAAEGTLVIADEQTAGKGRSGRVWKSPPGSAVYMTLLLRPLLEPARISMVTLVMGMAVAEAVRELTSLEAGIKWPNDVVVGGKKICGILTEMSAELSRVNYIVIGTGINVNMKQFPEELAQTATSVFLETGREYPRAELIACVMKHFEAFYEEFLENGDMSRLRDRYNELLVSRERGVRVLDPKGSWSGTALGIDAFGRLLVRDEYDEIKEVYAGEVSVRGIYGYV